VGALADLQLRPRGDVVHLLDRLAICLDRGNLTAQKSIERVNRAVLHVVSSVDHNVGISE